ncbi:MAG: transcription termination/antitermination protein NusA [Neisseriaceae bacterium]|nr:MAG: transcription termination/antitermination protein NusA [Neisseriaceae bacterium]
MSREILLLINALASEKNVDNETVFEAVEFALAGAARKKLGLDNVDIHVKIDKETGNYDVTRRWLVVDDLDYTTPSLEKTLEELQETDPDTTLQKGDYYTEPVPEVDFGRIGAQTAKRIILQRIRDAEKEQILNEFLQRKESLISGTVKRMDRQGVIVEIGKLEALLPRDQMIPRENLRVGDRIRAYLLKIEQRSNRPEIILTRTSKEFLIHLFEMEVPEIEEGSIEIKEVARDPGMRAKIAVKSNDPRIDPQGTCIGVRGSRVNNVSDALNGERIDVVLWSPEPAQFIMNALSPTEVTRILIDEDKHSVDVVVAEDQIAIAIGRGSQNVRLASKLTGWNLKILTVDEAEHVHQTQDEELKEKFMNSLDIDEEIADILVQEGFISLEEIAYVPIEELQEIEEFDEELISDLRTRARNAVLMQAIAIEEKLRDIDSKLKNLAGMNESLLKNLIDHNILTLDDFAELSAPELREFTDLTSEQASQLILEARSHWFEKTSKEGGANE